MSGAPRQLPPMPSINSTPAILLFLSHYFFVYSLSSNHVDFAIVEWCVVDLDPVSLKVSQSHILYGTFGTLTEVGNFTEMQALL